MGRPKTQIDEAKLKAFMRLKPSLADTSAFFECSSDTIERFIKRTWKLSFAEFRDQNMVHTRFMLVRKAIDMASKGDRAMLIFCLKVLCGWKETQTLEHTGKNGAPLDAVVPPQVVITLPDNGRSAKDDQ